MTTELFYLTLLSIFATMMWVPYIVGVNIHPSDNENADFVRPRDLSTLPEWVHRAHRAHLNLLEQLLPMAILILIANQLAVSNIVTGWCVVVFFWARIVHAIGMITGYTLFPARSIVFSIGWLSILTFASQVLMA